MHLKNLEQLHRNMQSQRILKTKFEFRFRELLFSIIYIADEFPHELLFGCRAHNLFFVLPVDAKYEINPYLGDKFKALAAALGLKYDPGNPFRTKDFFAEFDARTPITAYQRNTPTPNEIAANSQDVELSERIYFVRWLPHTDKTGSASPENLEKTKRTCGVDIYNFCLKHNVSSCWTAHQVEGREYVHPVGF